MIEKPLLLDRDISVFSTRLEVRGKTIGYDGLSEVVIREGELPRGKLGGKLLPLGVISIVCAFIWHAIADVLWFQRPHSVEWAVTAIVFGILFYGGILASVAGLLMLPRSKGFTLHAVTRWDSNSFLLFSCDRSFLETKKRAIYFALKQYRATSPEVDHPKVFPLDSGDLLDTPKS